MVSDPSAGMTDGAREADAEELFDLPEASEP